MSLEYGECIQKENVFQIHRTISEAFAIAAVILCQANFIKRKSTFILYH
jgi:hypothetical protein